MPTILLLGDITGRSRVALRMQTAVLEGRGHEVLALPTALISNTLNLGKHCALDTTQYLLESLAVWRELGLGYDLMSIGYITGMEQAKALRCIVAQARARGALVMVDPILGDGGKRYHSVSADQEAGMRLLMDEADLITPNLTEACILSGVPYEEAAQGGEALERVLAILSAGGRGVLVTGCHDGRGGRMVCGADASGVRFDLPYEKIPGHHWGTGDLYGAVLMDGLLAGRALRDAAQAAAQAVYDELTGAGSGLLPKP